MAAKRPPRKYAAYYRIHGTRKWKRRHPEIQGSKDSIVRTYQDWLIYGEPNITNVERQIRLVSQKKKV